jgi:hypothetical protein
MDEQLIAKNTELLERSRINAIRKRLKKELDAMYNSFAQIEVEIPEDHKYQVTVYEITAENKMQKYGFEITPNYPFTAPIVSFQGRPYKEFLRVLNTVTEYNVFKKVTGLSCFCCSSLTCRDNWTPSATLSRLIDEIRRVKKMKRDVVNKLMADKIKLRYLIDDIDFDSWLF